MADLTAVVATIFEQYDSEAEGTGTLIASELRAFYDQLAVKRPDLNLTDATYDEWFAKIDGDGTKTVSPEDLLGYLNSINYTH